MKNHKNGTTGLGDVIRSAGSSAGTSIEDCGNFLAEQSDRMVHEGYKAMDNLQDEAEKYGKTAATYIKKHPLRSALIAAGLGLFFGKFFKL